MLSGPACLRLWPGLLWQIESLRESIELPVEVEGRALAVTSSLESGVYVVSLQLFFEGAGDVNYGVLVALLPVEG
ncbi:MAG: hypothetical protein WEE64_15845 [Dehalococcoidia bacterium]